MERSTALDWNDLKYFLTVARAGGLTLAAQQLGSSASTVSRHIDALESRLGMRLFLRQQRGYLLTDHGKALLQRVLDVEAAMQAVERGGDALAGQMLGGTVTLAASEMISQYLIAPALPRFFARHPQVQVELIVSRNLADLTRREADLALRLISPDRHRHHPDYVAQRLGAVRFGVYATPAALASVRGQWSTLPYLNWDESWAMQPAADWMGTLFGGRPAILRSNSLQAQYVAARAGAGAVLLPRFLGDTDPALTLLTEDTPPQQRELWLVYHRDLKASQRVRALRDFIRETARETGLTG